VGTLPRSGSISPGYVFDNAAGQAGARFRALSEVFDPGTIRHLSERGVDEGWHCLEVGGGNASIASWLSRRVGHTGHVLVTDIDPRFLEAAKLPNVDVRRHNIVTDALPEGAFDLVHSRLVLLHLPERDKALHRMIAALKPGGWLVDEEFDSASLLADPAANPAEVLPKTQLALTRVVEDRGVERRCGRLVLGRLRAHGLVATGAEARIIMWQSGSAGASLMRANFLQLRADMINAGYITEAEFKHDLAQLEASDFLTLSPIMWTASGRRPWALSPSPNESTPPNHSSSWNGIDRSKRTTTFGRNRRMSRLRPASRPISRTVPEAVTEMLASSKMPCLTRRFGRWAVTKVEHCASLSSRRFRKI